jgi:predicted O-methyltransferase YrrM
MQKILKTIINSKLKNCVEKRWKGYWLSRIPRPIEQVSCSPETLENERFHQCLKDGKVYFGPVMAALQGVPIRHAYMQTLVEQECRRRENQPYKILEIGSWAGGSTITWCNAIQSFNKERGFVVCVDPWECYVDDINSDFVVYKTMHDALKSGNIFNLFLHNIRSSGFNSLVKVMKGQSRDILPLLKPESFDLVFVDGAHDYTNVALDLKNAAPLVRNGGILCGDDLELQVTEVDMKNAIENSASDYVLDPKNNRLFHPGVTLAVGELLPSVSAWQGFWAMRKYGTNWQIVE